MRSPLSKSVSAHPTSPYLVHDTTHECARPARRRWCYWRDSSRLKKPICQTTAAPPGAQNREEKPKPELLLSPRHSPSTPPPLAAVALLLSLILGCQWCNWFCAGDSGFRGRAGGQGQARTCPGKILFGQFSSSLTQQLQAATPAAAAGWTPATQNEPQPERLR